MFPHPLHIGPLGISFYGIFTALGVLAALLLFSYTAPRRGIAPPLARDFCFWMILAGLLGSRIFYVIFHWHEFSGDVAGVLAYWRGGLMFQGGVIFALVISPLVLRYYGLEFWPAADVMAPSLALGQALGRVGCFSAGCCYGQVTGSTLGVVFPPDSLAPSGLPLWPVQLFESAALLLLAGLLVWALNRWARRGRAAALYLLGAGGIRLVMEIFFRGDFRGEALIAAFPPTTLAAGGAFLLGLALFWRFSSRA